MQLELFELLEEVTNDNYYVKCFVSSHYDVNIIRNRKHNYKIIEVKKNESLPFVPTIYVDNEESNFELSVQTTSYGSLNLFEYSEFFEVQNKTFDYIREIQHLIEKY